VDGAEHRADDDGECGDCLDCRRLPTRSI
jgi:hypothetical protein